MPPCVLLLNLTLTHTLPPYGYGIKCFVATPQSPTIHWLCLHCHSNQDTGDRLTAPHIKYHLNPIEVYLSMFLTYIKSNITVIYCKNRDRNAPYCLGSHRGGIIKPRCRLRLPDKGSEICRGGEKKRKKKSRQTRERMQNDSIASENTQTQMFNTLRLFLSKGSRQVQVRPDYSKYRSFITV